MSINQFSATALQSIVRRVIKLDPEASKQLNVFSEKTILLSITDLELDYFINFTHGEISISENSLLEKAEKDTEQNTVQKNSATISGELSAFIAAVAAEHSSDSIFKGELQFSGEINTAKQFQAFAQSLNIDWQEPFAQLLGDPIAHTLTTGLKHFSSWFLSSAKSTQQDIAEYLQEEARVTVSDSEQQQFFQQVDQIRSRTDRLTARINHIAEQLDKTKLSPTEQESL